MVAPSVVFAVIGCLLASAIVLNAAQLRFAASLWTGAQLGKDGAISQAIGRIMQLAVDDVNRDVANPAGHNLTLTIYDAYSPGQLAAPVRVAFLAEKDNNVGLIGDWTSHSTHVQALMAEKLGLYTCTGAATSVDFSDTTKFPKFIRLIPSDENLGDAFAQYVAGVGWKAVAVLASNSAYGMSTAKAFLRKADKLGIFPASLQVFKADQVYDGTIDSNATFGPPIKAIADSGVRVVLFFGDVGEYERIAPVAHKAGIIGDEWAWIASESVAGVLSKVQDGTMKQEHVNGLQFLFPTEFANKPMADKLIHRWKQAFPADPFLPSADDDIVPYAAYHVDCVYALAHFFVKTLKSGLATEEQVLGRKSNISPSKVLEPFNAISGRVEFDESGKRTTSYSVYNVYGTGIERVYEIEASGQVKSIAPPKFYSGSAVQPTDRPDALIAYLRFSKPGAWIVLAVMGVCGLIQWASMAVLWVHRESRPVREHGLWVLFLLALGLTIVPGSTVTWIDEQTAFSCNVGLVSMLIGFELVVLPLLYRTYHAWSTNENTVLRHRSTTSPLPFIAMFFVQAAILGLWTFLAPLGAQPIATRRSFYYQCTSDNSVVNSVFKLVVIVWNLALLIGLLWLTYAIRRMRHAGPAQQSTKYVANNLCFAYALVTPLAIAQPSDFALATYWTHLSVVLYACLFTWGVCHGRVLLDLRRPAKEEDTVFIPAMLSRPGRGGMGGPDSNLAAMVGSNLVRRTSMVASSDLAPISGKPTTYSGEFPVKFPGLLQTWQLHRLWISQMEGFVGVARTLAVGVAEPLGQLWSLHTVSAVISSDLDLVVEIQSQGKSLFLVQMRSVKELDLFLHVFVDRPRGARNRESQFPAIAHGRFPFE